MARTEYEVSTRLNFRTNSKDLERAQLGLKTLSLELSSIIGTLDTITSFVDDLTTSQNILNQTFDDGVVVVNDYISNLTRMTGLTTSQVTKMSSLFGQMATSLGMSSKEASNFSIQLDDLSTKLALLYNADFNKTSKALLDTMKGRTNTLTSLTGIIINNATLQHQLATLGLDVQVKSLNSTEKAMLEYIAVANTINATNKDMSRYASDVAYQKRLLSQQVKELATSLGSILYPVVRTILIGFNAMLIVINTLINALKSLFGIGEDTKNLSTIPNIIDDIGTSVETTSNKLKKGLRSFDKLNNITTPTPTAESGLGAGISDDLIAKIKEMDENMLDIKTKAHEVAEEILKWLGFTEEANGKWKWTKLTIGDVLTTALLIVGAIKTVSMILNTFDKFKGIFKAIFGGDATAKFVSNFGKKLVENIGMAFETIKAMFTGGMGIGEGFAFLGELLAPLAGILAVAYGIYEVFKGINELKLGDTFNGVLDIVIGISAVVGGIALILGGWVVALVAGIVLVVAEIVKHWDKIKEILGKVGSWFNDHVIEPIKNFLKPIGDWIYNNVIQPIVDFFTPIFDAIGMIWNKIVEIVLKIIEIFSAISKAFYDYVVKPIWNLLYKGFIEPVADAIKEALRIFKQLGKDFYELAIKPMWEQIKALGSKLYDFFSFVFIEVGNFAWNVLAGAVNSVFWLIERTINNFINMLNLAIKLINKIPGVDIDYVNTLSLPRMEYKAEGGFVDSGEMFIARENGLTEMVGRIGNRTAVANNDQIVEAIEKGVMRANMATKSNNPVVIEAKGDASGLLDFITFKQKERERQYGF